MVLALAFAQTDMVVSDVFKANLVKEVDCLDAAYDIADSLGGSYKSLRCAEVSGTLTYVETALDYQVTYRTDATVTFNGPFTELNSLYVKSVVLEQGELLFLVVPQGRVTQYLMAVTL